MCFLCCCFPPWCWGKHISNPKQWLQGDTLQPCFWRDKKAVAFGASTLFGASSVRCTLGLGEVPLSHPFSLCGACGVSLCGQCDYSCNCVKRYSVTHKFAMGEPVDWHYQLTRPGLNWWKHTNPKLFGAHQSLNESLCRIRFSLSLSLSVAPVAFLSAVTKQRTQAGTKCTWLISAPNWTKSNIAPI